MKIPDRYPEISRSADRISSLYRSAGSEILKEIRKVGIIGFSEIKAAQAIAAADRIIEDLRIGSAKWANRSIQSSYSTAAKRSKISLEILNRKQNPFFDQKAGERSMIRYYEAILRDFERSTATIKGSMNSIINLLRSASRSASRVQYFDIWDYEAASELFEEWAAEYVRKGWSGRALESAIRDYLESALEDEDFIEINGRHFSIGSYAEMVARTRLREAQSQAVIDMCVEYGADLVEVSRHFGACEICVPFEGQVYSISGNSIAYAPLTPDDTPPYHPRCGHSIGPTSFEALEAREWWRREEIA